MGGDWVVVPNWQQFQHYSNRGPVWIKLYTELNSDDKWLGLSLAERGLLATVWLEFARSSGQVRLENVRRLCGSSARDSHVQALVQAGLLQLSASKPMPIVLATRAPARSREAEAETKEEKEPSLQAVPKPQPHNELRPRSTSNPPNSNNDEIDRLALVEVDPLDTPFDTTPPTRNGHGTAANHNPHTLTPNHTATT